MVDNQLATLFHRRCDKMQIPITHKSRRLLLLRWKNDRILEDKTELDFHTWKAAKECLFSGKMDNSQGSTSNKNKEHLNIVEVVNRFEHRMTTIVMMKGHFFRFFQQSKVCKKVDVSAQN